MHSRTLTTSVWEVDPDEFPDRGPVEAQAVFLLRYAILAPSSHNAQPWRFTVDGNEVAVAVDESRWLEAADPEKRERYISIGCAVANLRVAAAHFGFDAAVEYDDRPETERAATVTLRRDDEPSPGETTPPWRRSPHGTRVTRCSTTGLSMPRYERRGSRRLQRRTSTCTSSRTPRRRGRSASSRRRPTSC